MQNYWRFFIQPMPQAANRKEDTLRSQVEALQRKIMALHAEQERTQRSLAELWDRVGYVQPPDKADNLRWPGLGGDRGPNG